MVARTPVYVISAKSRPGSVVWRYIVITHVLLEREISSGQNFGQGMGGTHMIPTLSMDMARIFLRMDIRSRYKYGMGRTMSAMSDTMLIIPMAK